MINSTNGELTQKSLQRRANLNSNITIKGAKMSRDAYIVDEQNLASNGNFSLADSYQIRRILELKFGLTSHDRIHVATGPGTAYEAKVVFPDADVQVGHGPNGADFKLKDQLLELIPIAKSFGKIIIATGDHELIEEVKELRAAGGNVYLLGVRGSIHLPYFNLGIPVIQLAPLRFMNSADWTLMA